MSSSSFFDKESFDSLRVLFDLAESKLKETEQLCGDLAIPSVNELRYAGHHITRALSADSQSKYDEEIQKAEKHCKRAVYDANEVGVEYLLSKIRVFLDDYSRSSKVTDVIVDYPELLAKAQEAQDMIAEARKNNGDCRGDYYKECSPHFKELKRINLIFEKAKPIINNLEEEQEKKDKSSARRFIWQIILTISGLLISGAILAYKIG